MQVLLVEDDKSLAAGLSKALTTDGFIVNHVETGRAAIHVVETDAPDAVILDLGLPDLDGLDVLRQMRSRGKAIPVLILTARGSIDARVTGLDLGADDYLGKPFEMPELVARLRVIERRLHQNVDATLKIANVKLDTLRQQVFVDEKPVELARREFALLKLLMENAGKVQTRERLESRLYAWGEEVASNAIEVHIHHLRKKLGPDLIHTVRGIGYVIRQG